MQSPLKVVLIILAIAPCSLKLNAQNDTILKGEIPQIIIISDKHVKPNVFNLTNHRTVLSTFLECNDNVGVYIANPISSSKFSISSIEFPMMNKTNGDSWDFNFSVLIRYQNSDSLIPISPLSKMLKRGKIIYKFSDNISLKEPINGFYIFATYICPQKQFHGSILLEYTQNFKSKLTYRYLNNKAVLKDMNTSYKAPMGTFLDQFKFLNWKVKVKYFPF